MPFDLRVNIIAAPLEFVVPSIHLLRVQIFGTKFSRVEAVETKWSERVWAWVDESETNEVSLGLI